MEKNSSEMIKTTIKGMLPKNKMRPFYLSKVSVSSENSSDLESLKLPQFGIIKPIDYNKLFGIDHSLPLTPENYKLVNIKGDINECTFNIK